MSRLKINLNEKATKCVALAKAIARGEGDRRLDTIHVVRAGALAFPEEASCYFRQAGAGWSDALWGFVTPPSGFQAQDDQMPVTKGLAAAVHSLGRCEEAITLGALLEAILREPSVRVKAFLCRVGGTARVPGRRADGESGARPRYLSRRDWLADVRRAWTLRRSAARACGLRVGLLGEEPESKPYGATAVLNAIAAMELAVETKAKATPQKFDPLAGVAPDFDPVARRLCEGLFVNALYGLDVHPGYDPSIKDLAQMLSPETYPGNCRQVLEAVERLENQGIVTRFDSDHPVLLRQGVRLSEHVLDRLLSDLALDAISDGDARAMKRAVRHGEV